MGSVALVQNQSEMVHYGYADARPILRALGQDVRLYTGQNVEQLTQDLLAGRVDALMLASHAMNDKTIRAEVESTRFRLAVDHLLNQGGGCLVLHQLRLGEDARDAGPDSGCLTFLPDSLSSVFAMARPHDETAQVGRICSTRSADAHVLMLYPAKVDAGSVEQQCLGFKGLKGLYWHYWDGVDASRWDILLHDDRAADGAPRVLMACAKESAGHRVVLSSLTLDWQEQTDLLRNILTYVVEGRHHTAVLTTSQSTTVGISYLMERLRSQRYPFRVYDLDCETDEALRAIREGVHSIVVAASPALSSGDPASVAEIRERTSSGNLKLIEVDNSSFTVFGRERDALRLLYQVELKMEGELQKGYVDGSFWSTVEALQVLNRLPETYSRREDGQVDAALDKASGHDREGSYDEVLGVSCALLWLRARFIGPGSRPARRTTAWVESRLEGFSHREQALALVTLIESGISEQRGTSGRDTERLVGVLAGLDIGSLSEIDAMVFLQASLLVSDVELSVRLARLLCRMQQPDGVWVDLATTATTAVALLDARRLIPGNDSQTRTDIDGALFAAMIVIQRAKSRDVDAKYPWDEKASTSLKCIEAWLRFEELIELPVTEIVESLGTYARGDVELTTARAGLEVLEDVAGELRAMQRESVRLFGDVELAQAQMQRYASLSTRYWISVTTCACVIYVLLSYIAYMLWGSNASLGKGALLAPFTEAWGFHLAFLSFVATVLFGVLAVRQVRKHQEETDE